MCTAEGCTGGNFWMLVEAGKMECSSLFSWHWWANGSKSLFPLVREADVTRRNMENRCAQQQFLFEW